MTLSRFPSDTARPRPSHSQSFIFTEIKCFPLHKDPLAYVPMSRLPGEACRHEPPRLSNLALRVLLLGQMYFQVYFMAIHGAGGGLLGQLQGLLQIPGYACLRRPVFLKRSRRFSCIARPILSTDLSMCSTRNAESRDSNRNFKSHRPNRKKSLRGVVNRPLKLMEDSRRAGVHKPTGGST